MSQRERATSRTDDARSSESVRSEVRAWIETNAPLTVASVDAAWLCATWPAALGGRDLSWDAWETLLAELSAVGGPTPSTGFGQTLVGPTIIRWGTEDQQRRHLPGIRNGTTRWCQGFSEPGAGSDLAALTTTAVRDGDEWVINGQKLWTSAAFEAEWIFLLCRTNPNAPRHKGISYLLCPLQQPGIEVRRIRQIDGGAEFCEVFFNDARCRADDVVGDVDDGWTVAMTTLGFERGASEATGWRRFAPEFADIVELARENGRSNDPVVRQRLAAMWSRLEILRFHEMRDTAEVAAINKMYWSEYHRDVMELWSNLAGLSGQVLTADPKREAMLPGYRFRTPPVDYPASVMQSSFFFSRAETIWGGTAQIQRNIVAERVLGLPRDPGKPQSVP